MWHLRDTFQGPHCPARMGTLSGLSELQDLQSMFLHYNGEGPWLRVKKKVLAHFYPIPSFDFKRLSAVTLWLLNLCCSSILYYAWSEKDKTLAISQNFYVYRISVKCNSCLYEQVLNFKVISHVGLLYGIKHYINPSNLFCIKFQYYSTIFPSL